MARKKKPLVNPKRRRKTRLESVVGHVALYGKGFINDPNALPVGLTARQLLAGGRVAYDSFVRECGYAKDARIKPYDKLKAFQHTRWERIAKDVHVAMEKAR